jgi:hypothetical protein
MLLQVRRIFEAFGTGTSATFVRTEPGMKTTAPRLLLRYGGEAVTVLSDSGFEAPEDASAEHLRS